MQIKTFIRRSEYHDSVSLMLAASELTGLPGVADAAVLMGTEPNKAFLKQNGMLTDEAMTATPDDLVIAIKAETMPDDLAGMIEQALARKTKTEEQEASQPKTIKAALGEDGKLNLAIISVSGRFAAREAWLALRQGLHVLLFSDNVTIEDERALKEYAVNHGLLLMGPGAGTAIINGVGLGFANAVQRGPVGIVSAAGTGLQEVSCLLGRQGVGISQAIGTGGRDLKLKVGGLMFLAGIKALQEDPETKIIVLVSKPPHPEIADKVMKEIGKSNKPCVVCLLGSEQTSSKQKGMVITRTLDESAYQAARLVKTELEPYQDFSARRIEDLKKRAKTIKAGMKPEQKYLRGLYSGGTLCYETQIILNGMLKQSVLSNAPVDKKNLLDNPMQSLHNSVIDLGEEEFTVGRPHPMIDNTLRIRRLRQEAHDTETAVILLDMVIGYGAHSDPAAEFAPEIQKLITEATEDGRQLSVILSVTGTERDPQGLSKTEDKLNKAGAIVCSSNAEAARMAGWITT